VPCTNKLDKSTAKIVRGIVFVLLKHKAAWLDSSVMLKTASVKDCLQGRNSGEYLHLYTRAVTLVVRAGLGAAGLGTNPHGTPLVFLVKKVLTRDPAHTLYSNVLSALNFPVRSYQALPHAGEGAVPGPPASPSLELPTPLTVETSESICTVLTAFAAQAS